MTKLKTSHNILQNTTVLTLVLVMGLITATSVYTPPVFATHYYSGQKWGGTSVDMCYDSNSLGLININGATNQFSVVSGQLDGGRNDWNDEPSGWTFNKIGTQFCSHWNYSAALGSSGPLAVTYRSPLTGNPLTDNDTEFNRNYNWSTTNNCSSPYYLQSTAAHEYGHWLRLLDVSSGSSSDTIMWYAYSCNANTVKAHDSSTLTSIYG